MKEEEKINLNFAQFYACKLFFHQTIIKKREQQRERNAPLNYYKLDLCT